MKGCGLAEEPWTLVNWLGLVGSLVVITNILVTLASWATIQQQVVKTEELKRSIEEAEKRAGGFT